MNKYLVFLAVVVMFGSCAKQEEIVLEEAPNGAKNYFNETLGVTQTYESQNNEDNSYFHFGQSNSFSSYVNIGDVQMDKSYIYGNLGGNYDSYREQVSIKEDNENVKIRIEENHKEVYPSYSSSYNYQVAVSPYELHLLKANMFLNQTWTTSESVTLSYDGYYSYYPVLNDQTINSVFNYEVIELNPGSKQINNKFYSDLVTIKVDYNIGTTTNLTRTYTFANEIGLVAFSIQGKTFLLE